MTTTDTHLELTTEIVCAYVTHNSVSTTGLAELIRSVHTALAAPVTPVVAPAPELKPAVSIRASLTPDFIICLEDGKKFKSLKRHLRTHYNLTPEQYREKWNLPDTYPMVAPSYAATRSHLAKVNGLGRKPGPLGIAA